MGKDFKFKIHEGTERAETFMKVFGRLEVCVKSFIPEFAQLPGFDDPQMVYKLDLNELTYDERIRLADFLSERFNVALSEVDSLIESHGVPILTSEGIITVENPHKWIDTDVDEDDYHDDDDEFDFDCHMTSEGFCMAAGSEDCDWHCPYNWSEDED